MARHWARVLLTVSPSSSTDKPSYSGDTHTHKTEIQKCTYTHFRHHCQDVEQTETVHTCTWRAVVFITSVKCLKAVILCGIPALWGPKEAGLWLCTSFPVKPMYLSILPALSLLNVLHNSVRECLIPIRLDGLPLQPKLQSLIFFPTNNTTHSNELTDGERATHESSYNISLLESAGLLLVS